jgi:hypothetical protein
MKTKKKKIVFILFALVVSFTGNSQIKIRRDTINFSLNENLEICYSGANFRFKYEFNSDSSAIIVKVFDKSGLLLKSFERFNLNSELNEYDEFEVSNSEIILSEIGLSRFLGISNNEYVFEIFNFHREGITNSLLYFDLNLLPIKDEIIVLDRNGNIGRKIYNVYVKI